MTHTTEIQTGDEVLINDRSRALTVVPLSEVDNSRRPTLPDRVDVWLQGNGTYYSIRLHEGKYPVLSAKTNNERILAVEATQQ